MLLLALGVFAVLSGPAAWAAPCTVEWGGQKAALDQKWKTGNVSSVLSFLSEFKTSREVSLEVSKRVRRKELSFAPLSTARSGQALDDNPAALFDIVSGVPKIFVEDSEFGVLAAVLFHEMVHATDEIYAQRFTKWEAAVSQLDAQYASLDILSNEYTVWKKQKSFQQSQRDKMVFDAERLAFDSQQSLVEEIGERFECAKAYFKQSGEKKLLVVGDTSDEQIATHFNLSTLISK